MSKTSVFLIALGAAAVVMVIAGPGLRLPLLGQVGPFNLGAKAA